MCSSYATGCQPAACCTFMKTGVLLFCLPGWLPARVQAVFGLILHRFLFQLKASNSPKMMAMKSPTLKFLMILPMMRPPTTAMKKATWLRVGLNMTKPKVIEASQPVAHTIVQSVNCTNL
jgi:hypothetical protein